MAPNRPFPASTASAEPSPYLTVPEAAKILMVGRNSLYEAIKLGQVPGVVRVGKLIRIRRTALVESGRRLGEPTSEEQL